MKGTRLETIWATSGAALVGQFLLQFIAGWYLGRAYIATPEHAHKTMETILGGTPHAFIAGFHYWGSAVLIVHSGLHLTMLLLTGGYRSPNQWRWLAALAFFGCAFLFQLTGNLLPFDKHGVQTAAIEAGIANMAPVLGPDVAAIMMGGEPSFTAKTLPLWYKAHQFLIPLALVLGIAGMCFQQFFKRDLKENRVIAFLIVLIPLALAAFLPTPLGTAATEADYNQFNAQVSWYTWPLHGSLQLFNSLGSNLGWVGATAVPGLFAAFLVLLPLISKRLAHGGVQIVFGVFALYFLAAGLFFGGSFAPLTGTRDPIVAETTPPTGGNLPSPIDAVLAAKGRTAFNENCMACHGQDGKTASGGPVLSDIHKRQTDAQWYIDFIKDPKSKKPGSTMPGFADLGEEKLRAMAEFLRDPTKAGSQSAEAGAAPN